MKSAIVLFLLLSPLPKKSHSQNIIRAFGKVSPEELNMKDCPFEKGADAMQLLKTQKISFDLNEFSGYPTTFPDFRARIKIFTEAGFKSAVIKVPYFFKKHFLKNN